MCVRRKQVDCSDDRHLQRKISTSTQRNHLMINSSKTGMGVISMIVAAILTLSTHASHATDLIDNLVSNLTDKGIEIDYLDASISGDKHVMKDVSISMLKAEHVKKGPFASRLAHLEDNDWLITINLQEISVQELDPGQIALELPPTFEIQVSTEMLPTTEVSRLSWSLDGQNIQLVLDEDVSTLNWSIDHLDSSRQTQGSTGVEDINWQVQDLVGSLSVKGTSGAIELLSFTSGLGSSKQEFSYVSSDQSLKSESRTVLYDTGSVLGVKIYPQRFALPELADDIPVIELSIEGRPYMVEAQMTDIDVSDVFVLVLEGYTIHFLVDENRIDLTADISGLRADMLNQDEQVKLIESGKLASSFHLEIADPEAALLSGNMQYFAESIVFGDDLGELLSILGLDLQGDMSTSHEIDVDFLIDSMQLAPFEQPMDVERYVFKSRKFIINFLGSMVEARGNLEVKKVKEDEFDLIGTVDLTTRRIYELYDAVFSQSDLIPPFSCSCWSRFWMSIFLAGRMLEMKRFIQPSSSGVVTQSV